MSLRASAALLAILLLQACKGQISAHYLSDEEDAGLDATGDADGLGMVTLPCPAEGCPAGQECVEDHCITLDPCRGVVCTNSGEVCSGGVCLAGESDNDGDGVRARDDCDDTRPEAFPGAPEACNGRDDDCDREIDEDFDADDDGVATCGTGDGARVDCDDADPAVFPGAPETCNGRDDDCDGTPDDTPIDEGIACGASGGECAQGRTVCRDGAIVCDGGANPGAEDCNGLDDDCDGEVDNGIGPRPCTGACGGGTEECVGGRWVCDAPTTGECRPGETQSEPCDCGTRMRACTETCTWGPFEGCSGGPCSGGEVCCNNRCVIDVDNCGGCGAACDGGYRAACCYDEYGWGCCPDGYPVCAGGGYCSMY